MTHSSLSIRLTEPITFLRADHASPRRRIHTDPPAIIRGLLTLTLDRPTKISTIEIDIDGKSKNNWLEGIGPRRVEVVEEHKIIHANAVFFNAAHELPTLHHRRHASIGPGVAPDSDSDSFSDAHHDEDDSPSTTSRPPMAQRRVSVDRYRHYPSPVHDALNLYTPSSSHTIDNTPPYTPLPSPRTSSSHITAPTSPVPSPQLLTPRSEHASSSASTSSVNPGEMLEGYRMALRHELEGASPQSPDLSSHVSPERTSQSPGPSTNTPSKSKSRSRARFSLPLSIPHVLKEVGEKVRSVSRGHVLGSGSSHPYEEERGRSPPRHPMRDEVEDNAADHPRGRTRRNKGTLEKLGERLKAAAEEIEGVGIGGPWKEFRKGTYTYPISFALPHTLPPTAHLPHGELTYKLKASVHRPGAFTPKLHTARELILVSCPNSVMGGAGPTGEEEEMEEGISIEREWEDQLRYRIELNRRKFEQGGEVEIRIRLIPFEKVRLWRVDVFLEERVDYLSNYKRVILHEPAHLFELWSVRAYGTERHKEKEKEKQVEIPLLPILSDAPNALFTSPLSKYVLAPQDTGVQEPEGEDALSEALPSLFGPGPYHLVHTLRIPTCGEVHASYVNPTATSRHPTSDEGTKSNAEVRHHMKVVLRVEKCTGVGAGAEGAAGGGEKRKKWDIVVQVGVSVLSCHSARKWAALPLYSVLEDRPLNSGMETNVCPCALRRRGVAVDNPPQYEN